MNLPITKIPIEQWDPELREIIEGNEVIEVKAIKLPRENKKTGDTWSEWRYVARLFSGEEIIIRKTATRLYPSAFLYFGKVCSGNKRGLSLFFTFGKKPNAWNSENVIQVYPVKVNKDDLPE